MTRLVLTVAVLCSGAAWADVGPKPPRCSAPAECTTCWVHFGDGDAGHECGDGAIDAGLVKADCTDTVGAGRNEYYCPKGVPVGRCGCDAGGGLGLAILAWVLAVGGGRLRTRKASSIASTPP